MSGEIRDAKLLARVKRLVVGECAGYIAELNGAAHACVEPRCPWTEGTCAYFQAHSTQCPFFEQAILPRADSERYDDKPLDLGLGEAYARHVEFGETVTVGRCEFPGCRKQKASAGPNARYCQHHARWLELKQKRDSARQWRERRAAPDVEGLAS